MSPFPFTIQAAKPHITTTHLTVRLKANIAHHQMATSYDNKEIIIGGDFFIVHLWELVKLIYLTKNA